MNVSPKSEERRCLLRVAEALELMLAFGSFVLLLVNTILALLKNDKKK